MPYSQLRFRALQPGPERIAYRPGISRGPPRHAPAPSSAPTIFESVDESTDGEDRDAKSAISIAPSRDRGDRAAIEIYDITESAFKRE